MDKRKERFKRWLIAGGIFNIMVSSLYIFPFSVNWNISILSSVHQLIALSGNLPSDTLFAPLALLYINGFGIVDVSLGILLLYNAEDIENRSMIAFVDAVARASFALIMLYYVFMEHISIIAFCFALIELLFAYIYIKYTIELGLVKYSSNVDQIKS